MQFSGITIYQGAEGIKKAYEYSLTEEKHLDIVCLSSDYEHVIGDYFDKQYAPKLYGKTISTREILPDTSENRSYNKDKDQNNHQVHFLSNTASESDMVLGENKAIFISYNKNVPFALIIHDRELIAALKDQFQALWASL